MSPPPPVNLALLNASSTIKSKNSTSIPVCISNRQGGWFPHVCYRHKTENNGSNGKYCLLAFAFCFLDLFSFEIQSFSFEKLFKFLRVPSLLKLLVQQSNAGDGLLLFYTFVFLLLSFVYCFTRLPLVSSHRQICSLPSR